MVSSIASLKFSGGGTLLCLPAWNARDDHSAVGPRSGHSHCLSSSISSLAAFAASDSGRRFAPGNEMAVLPQTLRPIPSSVS